MSAPTIEDARPDTPATPGDNLARRTAHGLVWLVMQTVGAKIIGMAGQFVLAWLLYPQDFGLWGMAMAVIGFTSLIQQAGLREILIYRQHHYRGWANTAFWMSLMLGVLGAAITLVAAFPANWFFKSPRDLIGILLVLAATMPLQSVDLVAEAKLQIEMRFGLLAAVKWMETVVTLALSVLLAWLGFGAYSFVLPRPIVSLARLAVLWKAARPPVRWNAQVARWKFLLRDSLVLLLSNVFLMIQWQGDYLILGRFFDPAVVGLYFMAFNLSIQTMQLFTGNLSGVLFPALSKLKEDPRRQIRAFLDATRMLALGAVPLCFIQMAAADPGVRLFFQDAKWQGCIPALQALSIGMAFRVVSSPGGSLIQAQGRFRVDLLMNIINSALFLMLVLAGGWMGQPNAASVWLRPAATVSIAVATYFAIVGPIFLYVAIYPSGGTWADVWRAYAAPLLCSTLAVAVAMAMGSLVPVDKIRGHQLGQFARMMVIVSGAVALYIPLVRFIAPESWQALISRLAGVFARRKSRA